MYTAYFGLSEAPFTIAPDPAYLFMSDRHREALAHLSYGLGDNGGFVLLTGEVGTGKTTISRTVMDKLPENTQASFILNPTLSCEELLACICDNLKIRYKKTGATLKYLTDKIQTKLQKNHQENINTLLIIDEAQHLKPEVLEQLRLLTNLETNTKKLLQVILIGQPELQQLLQRRDLRQLAQRITARYHLLPLTKQELSQYIQHRLSVAHCTRALFNKAAISALHKISNGIPRVINLLCERALVIAYSKNDAVIGRSIIQQAAVEALGDHQIKAPVWHLPMKIASLILLVGMVGYLGYWFGTDKISTTDVVLSTVADSPKNNDANQTIVENQLNTNVATDTQQTATSTVNKAQPNQLAPHLNLDSPTINQSNNEVVNADTEQLITDDAALAANIEQHAKPRVLGYQPEKVTLTHDNKVITNEQFDIVAEPGVSEDVLTRFKAAIDETKPTNIIENQQNVSNQNDHGYANTNDEIIDDDVQQYRAVHQLPVRLQESLPSLQFDMHIFATEGQGWVRVNGKDRREGEQIAQGVVLTKIFPQQVLLSYQQEQFTMPALSSW
ncbi:AAA family ATPase [Colwellia sp. 1_MG-2023]|uniref:AAA family ATPase n=1 Tax=Colwellia sp. 1_MG-2023 TaxID=3062649 RepID=UPI0026E45513|nr:AAA family ATPase [Colwellia sp. 1_MG-2023]MDO6445537.1 AAA family ATPase [Colwellia sp. 1_MG-2023]